MLKIAFALLAVLLLSFTGPVEANDTLTYTQLRNLVRSGKTSEIRKVIVTVNSTAVEVQLASDARFQSVLLPPETREKLITELDQSGVDIEVRDADKSGFWFSMLSAFFLPVLLLVGFLFMFNARRRPD